MTYVDGYVLAVPEKNLADYREMAERGAAAWKKHGALAYVECVGDDLEPDMPGVRFPNMVNAREGETVVFSLNRFFIAGASR